MVLQHHRLPPKLSSTLLTSTMPIVLLTVAPLFIPTETSTSATWTFQSLAPTSSVPWMALMCTSWTSTCPRTATAQFFQPRWNPAAWMDHTSPKAPKLTHTAQSTVPSKHLKGHQRRYRRRTLVKNHRSKWSRWARAIAARHLPLLLHLLRLHTNLSTPLLAPPPPCLLLTRRTTLTFRTPASTARFQVTPPACTNIRTFTHLAGRTPLLSSTAWLWRRLHAALPLSGSSPSTRHSPGLDRDCSLPSDSTTAHRQ